MHSNRSAALAAVFVFLTLGTRLPAGQVVGQGPAAQAPAERNPFEGDAAAILAGQGQFRSRCADCHGIDAKGVRGPDITGLKAAGASDERLFLTLRNGVQGTEMPAVSPRTPDSDIWKMLAYLSTLSVPATPIASGNAENGARIFRAQCAGCHRVDGEGGRLGPDLSRVGATRPRASIVRQIRGANEEFIPGYAPVTLLTPTGQRIRGVKKNEDLFSVQIMDTRERIQGYLKNAMRDVTNETRSAMPVYTPEMLSENDLNDLLQYLNTLRAPAPL
jgi:cytochrome c oxidase cbb3-type subunit III